MNKSNDDLIENLIVIITIVSFLAVIIFAFFSDAALIKKIMSIILFSVGTIIVIVNCYPSKKDKILAQYYMENSVTYNVLGRIEMKDCRNCKKSATLVTQNNSTWVECKKCGNQGSIQVYPLFNCKKEDRFEAAFNAIKDWNNNQI